MTVDLKTSRRTLPAPMLDRSAYSIFSVIKQAIGKDLTRFSIPVVWNEPLSFLQRLAECLEHSSLLDRAALADSPVERFHYLTAFVVSTLSIHIERMSKPFNPLLGETYELEMNDDQHSFHFISEQVSHHPPVSAIFIQNPNWTLSANVEPKIKFHGTNVQAISDGRWILRIKKRSRSNSQSSFQSCEDYETSSNEFEDEYTWKTPNVLVHNIIFGRLWCEFQGQIDIKHTQSDYQSILTIKSHSWFASQATKTADLMKYSGFIYNAQTKLSAFHGNYGHCYYAIDNLDDAQSKTSTTTSKCSIGGHNCIHLGSSSLIPTPCDLVLTPSSRCIWYRTLSPITENELALRAQYYFFTLFACCLNEQITLGNLPSTDSRYRDDIRYLERGEIQASSDEKHRLEEQQRADAKQYEHNYEPLWFKKDSNGEYIYTHKYEQRNFESCPKLFSQG